MQNVNIDFPNKNYLPIIINNQERRKQKLSLIGYLMFGLKSFAPSPNVQVPTLFFWLETKNENCNEWTVDKESIARCNLSNNSNQKISYFSLINESSTEIRTGIKAINLSVCFLFNILRF